MTRRGRITVVVCIGLALVAIAAIEVASGLSQEESAAAEVVLAACSVRKNTGMSRAWHRLLARDNAWFNANLKLLQAFLTWQP